MPTRFGRYFGNLFSTAGGYAVGSATADTLRPVLQDEVNLVWSHHPAMPLPAEVAADAEIVGAYKADDVRRDASFVGLSATRANALRALAGTAPGFAQLAAMRNRNRITDVEFERGLAQLGVRDEWRDDVRQLRFELATGQELALMAVQGVLDVDDAKAAALLVGTDGPTFDRYYRLSGEPPGAQQLLELWNRGAISEGDVDRGLRQSRLKPEWVPDFKALRHVLVPVSDLVRFAVREVFNPQQRAALNLDAEFPAAFAAQAARLGLDETAAKQYWAAHWDLPSYTQGVEMYHRGLLSGAQLDDLLKALDFAPTWRDKLRRIADRIPPISDMIRFAVREVYDPAQRRTLGLDADYPPAFTAEAALHGMDEERARQYWAAHWKLPSAQQGYQMLWRGLMDEAQLDELLKALDYPAVWRERLASIAYHVPGRIDLRRMFAAGVIDEGELRAGYKRLGYNADDAGTLTEFAKRGATVKVRELTAAQLATEFEAHYLTPAQYRTRLTDLGYADAEADLYVGLSEARLVKRAKDATLSTIRSNFVGHRLQATEARAALRKTGLSAGAADAIMAEWVQAEDANRAALTPAQIRDAYRRTTLTLDAALARLTDRGYSDDDARLFLGLAERRLTASQVVAGVRARTITEAEGLAQLRGLGYTTETAHELLAEQITELTSKQIQDAVGDKTITRDEGLQRLALIGYRPEDALLLLPAETAPPAV